MKVILDEKNIILGSEDINNFGSLMDKIYKQYIPSGRVLYSVILNGTALSPEEENEKRAMPLDEISSLEMTTSSQQDVVLHSLSESEKTMTYIIGVVSSLREHLRGADPKTINDAFTESVNGLSWLLEIIRALHMPSAGLFDEIMIREKSAKHMEEALISSIQQLIPLYERQDLESMADFIEMELLEVLDWWKEALMFFYHQSIKTNSGIPN